MSKRRWPRAPRPIWFGAFVLAVVVGVTLWWKPGDFVAEDTAPPSVPVAQTQAAQQALTQWWQARASEAAQAGLALSGVSARVIEQNGAMQPDGRWSVQATVTWAYAGLDPSPTRTEVTVRLRTRGDEVAVTGLSQPGRVPLWAAEKVRATRTGSALVVTADALGQAGHDDYVTWATRAVAVVSRVVSPPQRPLVVEVPATTGHLADALGVTTGEVANIAAITATTDGSSRADAPIHVLVNHGVMAGLDARSSQIVLSHEATHAATAAVLTDNRPIWLSEGFADYVALRDAGIDLRHSAAQIAARVRADGVPEALPQEADFDAASATFGSEYEAAWLVCEQIVADAGQDALVRLYDDVGAGMALGRALQRAVGYDVATLTRRWQERLRGLPGA